MSVQNRLRIVVSVVLLLMAIAVFVPRDSTDNDDPDGPASNANLDDEKGERSTSRSMLEESTRLKSGSNEIQPLFYGNTALAQSQLGAPHSSTLDQPTIDRQPRESGVERINRNRPEGSPVRPEGSPVPGARQRLSASGRSGAYIPIEPQHRGNNVSQRSLSDAKTLRHTIQPGESLQMISIKYFGHPGEYLRIYEFNSAALNDPVDLPAGVEIKIPYSD